ncbi:MAG: hypothetical protein K0S65_1809 [Labilithrix sp.]|nr:hypothetical protein [Labilithrix sp.]
MFDRGSVARGSAAGVLAVVSRIRGGLRVFAMLRETRDVLGREAGACREARRVVRKLGCARGLHACAVVRTRIHRRVRGRVLLATTSIPAGVGVIGRLSTVTSGTLGTLGKALGLARTTFGVVTVVAEVVTLLAERCLHGMAT